MQIFQKIFSESFVKEIQSQGGEVFAVGGCVRDHFMGKDPKDLDLIVRLVPVDTLQSILQVHGKVDLVGESFGVFKFKMAEGHEFDIALPRRDRKIEGEKGHKSIEAQSDHTMELADDLLRRDFCFNAMAVDFNLQLIDPFEGLKDIQEGTVRAVSGDAFVEDPLRMVRAIQFAARFGFVLDKQTAELVFSHKHLIREITAERVLEEFKKVFDKKGKPDVLMTYMIVFGLWEEYFGSQAERKEYGVTRHLSEMLHMSVPSSVDASEFFKDRLKIDNDLYKDLKAFHILSKCLAEDPKLYEVHEAVFHALQKSDILFRSIHVSPKYVDPFRTGQFPTKMSELAVNGEDFLKLGYMGKEIGDTQRLILKLIFKSVLSNKREDLLTFIKQHKQSLGK